MANFVKARPNKPVITPHLDSFLARGVFPASIPLSIDSKAPDTAYHPSSRDDTLPCLCKVYENRKEVPLEVWIGEPGEIGQKHSASSQKNFHVGHMYHGWLQWIISEGLGFSTPEEIEETYTITSDGSRFDITDPVQLQIASDYVAKGNWWAKGSIDISCCRIPGVGDFLIDIKTMGSYPFKVFNPPESYIVQLQLYMDWHGMERAILLGVNKDSGHDFKELIVEYDPAVAEAVYEKWDTVNQAIFAGSEPECTCSD